MKKFAVSSLVIAGLLGATGIASAQMNQPTRGESSQGNVGPNNTMPSTSGTGMTTGTGAGTATGTATGGMNNSGTSSMDARTPASQGNANPGSTNNMAPSK